ncbi:mechanosensitive ion channel [Suttonella sp. R2A3]|uniref:mechanosensitive ion channel family protein n=1 Tax=Suttonella sp. R2A3 TaxID=2908648 RepID=UPI001F3C41B2|nr:mechanosensitive ion channel family protein [Suttonella sp. R2A3]UJF23900.1 mechanosensitive ion channel [Suttonella sp. R2A3]
MAESGSTQNTDTVPGDIDFTDVDEVLGINTLSDLWQEQGVPMLAQAWDYLPFILAAVILVVLYTLIFWGLRLASSTLLRRMIKDDDKYKAARQLSQTVIRLTWLMICAVTVFALMPFTENYTASIARAYALLLFLLLGWSGLHYFIRLQSRRHDFDESLTLLLKNIVRILLVLLGIYLIFRQFGVNLLPILGGLGVVGLAVGFAAQDILANFISGITLLIDRPFRIGDWIRTNDHEGRVKGLTLRTTRIRTRNNEYVSIPNKDLAGSVVTNLSHGGPLRVDIPLGVAYKSDIDQVREVLLEVIESFEVVLTRPAPVVMVKELGDSSVNVLMRIWLSDEDLGRYPTIRMTILEAAKKALDAHEIEIPFPHLQLHIDGAKALEPFFAAKKDKGE